MMRVTGIAAVSCLLLAGGSTALAQDVRLTEGRADASFTLNDTSYTIARSQDPASRLPDSYALTARPCPPACIQPARAAPGVETLAELEVIGFLQDRVSAGTGLVIDARMPPAYTAAAIPGAVNVPTTTVSADNPYRADILRALGAEADDGAALDFSTALDLVIYGEGPWNPEAAQMVRNLLGAGYPADKLRFYRGGMQGWLSLGLTTVQPQTPG